MKFLVESIGAMLVAIAYFAGIVLAPGWWKVAAFFFPPYPLYLVVERGMQMAGLVG